MFCMSCGTQLPDTAQFCYKCGQRTDSLTQQETKIPDTTPKTFDEVPEVIKHKMAEILAKNPLIYFRYELLRYEEAAQQFVSDEIMQQAIELSNVLDKVQDKSILDDLEVKRLKPVLYLYKGALAVWQTLYHRWEADWQSKQYRVTWTDFQILGEKGIVELIKSAGLSETYALAIYEHMGLRVWLEYRLLRDNMYFLLLQGQNVTAQLSVLKKLYEQELVELAAEQAATMYKAFVEEKRK